MAVIKKTCPVCGVEFKAKRESKFLCSLKCKSRRWREKNPEKDRECRRRWRKKNPEKHRERLRCWRKKNPGQAEKDRERARIDYRKKSSRKIAIQVHSFLNQVKESTANGN